MNYRVARLGNNADENLELHIIFVKNYGPVESERVVDDLKSPAKIINKIEAGEYFEGNIYNISCPNYPDYALFKLTKQDNIAVLKTLKKAIPW